MTEDQKKVLNELLICCMSWEPQACVMGNVRAGDAAEAIKAALASETSEELDGFVQVPVRMNAAMINAWSGGKTVTSDEVAYRTHFQEAWTRVLDAAPRPVVKADQAQKLTVWYGSMPESNGKSNWTAILHKGDLAEGHTIDRSEYPDRVRYEADCVRYLIGELDERPFILDYDADKHSGYVDPHR